MPNTLKNSSRALICAGVGLAGRSVGIESAIALRASLAKSSFDFSALATADLTQSAVIAGTAPFRSRIFSPQHTTARTCPFPSRHA